TARGSPAGRRSGGGCRRHPPSCRTRTARARTAPCPCRGWGWEERRRTRRSGRWPRATGDHPPLRRCREPCPWSGASQLGSPLPAHRQLGQPVEHHVEVSQIAARFEKRLEILGGQHPSHVGLTLELRPEVLPLVPC